MFTATDDRIGRYLRRYQLGLRFVSHGARSQTTTEWCGLTRDQLITLRRKWNLGADDRRRGPAPTSLEIFFRSQANRERATVFAMIYLILRARPKQSAAVEEQPFVSLENGEILCEALEIYRTWQPDDALEFEYALLLARAVSQERTVRLSRCSGCHRITMIDGRKPNHVACTHVAQGRSIVRQDRDQPMIQG